MTSPSRKLGYSIIQLTAAVNRFRAFQAFESHGFCNFTAFLFKNTHF